MTFDFISLETIQDLAHHYGYAAIFVGILLENAGIPLPGETITLTGGFLAGSGELNYWLVLASAFGGAVSGDSFGYWIGRWGGWNFLVRLGRLFRLPEEKLIEVKLQFSDNADKAVLLGRFIALLRIFAGPLAGIVEMPYPRFLLFNAIGASLWASVMVTLAYTIGRVVPLSQLVAWVGQFAIVVLLLVVLLFALPHLFKPKPSP